MESIPLKWVADHIAPSAYAWAKSGRLPTVIVDGEKHVRKTVVDQLEEGLGDTCSLAVASRLIGTSKSSMRYYIDVVKVVKTKTVNGRERVLRSCISEARKYVEDRPKRMQEQNRRSASTPRAKLMNLLRRGFGTFVTTEWKDQRIYIPSPEARQILGVSYGVFNRWRGEGVLRKKKLRGRKYIESSSMRSLRVKTLGQIRAWRIKT